ncbi:MAG: AraC family transcriptional regulator [Paenibacillaceae bacterium]
MDKDAGDSIKSGITGGFMDIGGKIKTMFSYRTFANRFNNNNTWFYKTLFSYLPVFFFIFSVLFLILFLAFSEHIKKTTIKSNEIFVKQISQSVDNILSPIDKMVVKEMLANETLNIFFESENLGKYSIYATSKVLKDLILNMPIIDSAYIFHQSDQLIISDSIFTSINNFMDQDFIRQQLSQSYRDSWTGRRMYENPRKNDVQPVVSLVKKYPFHTGEQGLVVINIRVDSIRNLVVNMSNFETGFVHLFDDKGKIIISTEEMIQPDLHTSDIEKPLAKANSNYTGWEIHSGFDNGNMFSFFLVFPYFWVTLLLMSIGVGIVWIIYVTRRSYKPIKTIINRINESIIHNNSELFNKSGSPNEMRFIEIAIEDLMEQTTKFQNQYEEDLIRLRHNYFKEIVEGNRPLDFEEWKYEMQRLDLYTDFDTIVLNILEIDKYYDFITEYKKKDQYLLKFVLNSVVNEIAQTHDVQVWAEWISNEQIGILYMLKSTDRSENNSNLIRVQQMSNAAITWIKGNLNFTVTFGIGGETDKPNDIPDLYVKALEALKYKPVLGNQRVINHWELPSKPRVEIYNHVQFISTIANSYRLGDSIWESQYKKFFNDLKMGIFPREDIISLIQYLIYYFNLNMNELSDKLLMTWKKNTMPILTKMIDHFENLDEFENKSYQLLKNMGDEIQNLRENQINYQLIHDMRKYIEVHYANPDLSLDQLSDEFNLSSRYLSQLFKDEFGEKFIDYLVKIRIDAAIKLLQETTDPVQSIALKVGYLHSFSFIRVFKKVIGKTPGDFRK